jgi:4-diphosphocytidyl-2-C-methyl-D-erythritol kinase
MPTIRAIAANESSHAARNLGPIVLAYAKINLTLEVLARRDDGYHALRSVMLPIGLADEIRIEAAERFSFACEPPELAPNNLVLRALERIGLDRAAVAVTLRKRIPVGAGLGGGSSDAAAMLHAALDGAFGPPPKRDWLADARALGSDVPFFLVGGGALVEGTGERVTALGALPPWHVVLLVPAVHVATGDAFGRLARRRAHDPPPSRPRSDSASMRALVAVQRADYEGALAAAVNDFEPLMSAAYPPVAAALNALRAAGAEHAMLSGSGGACFALCRDADSAQRLAAAVRVPPRAALAVAPFAPSPAWRAPSPVT